MADTWSSMTVGEHLDAAGELFAKHASPHDHVNGLHKDLIQATAHVQAHFRPLGSAAAVDVLGVMQFVGVTRVHGDVTRAHRHAVRAARAS